MHQDSEKGAVTPQETEPDLSVSVQEFPAEAWGNSGLLRGQGLQQHWKILLGVNPLGVRH